MIEGDLTTQQTSDLITMSILEITKGHIRVIDIGDGPLGQKGQLPPLSGNELKFQEQKSGIAWLRNELFK